MKAWEDLERDEDIQIWYTGDANDPDSYWYLDMGVKIEKLRDGTIELYNVMVPGMRIYKMNHHDRRLFDRYGWYPGLYKFNKDWFKYLIDTTESESKVDEYTKKYLEYSKYFEKFLLESI